MSGSGRPGFLASFQHLDATLDAIKGLRKEGFRDITAYAPFPEHHIEEALGYGKSPVRVFTLTGGLVGAAAGFAFPAFTSLDWPLVTGGKPILSMPAYVVIAFEMTILLGVLFTVIGLFINMKFPHLKPIVIYDPEFTADRFGIYVGAADEERLAEARKIVDACRPDRVQEDPEGLHHG